jgi:hypothetical protein
MICNNDGITSCSVDDDCTIQQTCELSETSGRCASSVCAADGVSFCVDFAGEGDFACVARHINEAQMSLPSSLLVDACTQLSDTVERQQLASALDCARTFLGPTSQCADAQCLTTAYNDGSCANACSVN